MNRLKVAATLLLIVTAATISIAKADVKVHKDPDFDFTRLATFDWSAAPGTVKIWVTIDSNAKAEPVKRQYEPILMETVNAALEKRGYTRASGAKPDFELIYYVLITRGSSSQQMGQFLPTNAQWGIPLYSLSTTALDFYPTGSIVLDVMSPAGGRMVWRGIAEARVEVTNTESERSKRVQDIMNQLVSKFPKRTK